MESKEQVLIYGMSNNIGGIENYLLSIQSQLHNKYSFVFIVDKSDFIYKDLIYKYGGIIEYVDKDSQSILDVLKKYSKTISILYINISDLKHENVQLMVFGIYYKYRIFVHAHGAMLSPIRSVIHRLSHFFVVIIGRILLANNSIIKLAVSSRAGKYIFGNLSYEIVSPGININDFKFNPSKRTAIKKELEIENCFILGFIGRLVDIKNPCYVLQILIALINTGYTNIFLLFVGDGPLRYEIEQIAIQNKVNNKIKITGLIDNVNDYLQVIDCVVGSSLSEGYPLSLIEAQVSGCQCVCAEESYPPELAKTNHFAFVPFNNGQYACIRKIEDFILNSENILYDRLNDKDDYSFFDEKYTAKKIIDIFADDRFILR